MKSDSGDSAGSNEKQHQTDEEQIDAAHGEDLEASHQGPKDELKSCASTASPPEETCSSAEPMREQGSSQSADKETTADDSAGEQGNNGRLSSAEGQSLQSEPGSNNDPQAEHQSRGSSLRDNDQRDQDKASSHSGSHNRQSEGNSTEDASADLNQSDDSVGPETAMQTMGLDFREQQNGEQPSVAAEPESDDSTEPVSLPGSSESSKKVGAGPSLEEYGRRGSLQLPHSQAEEVVSPSSGTSIGADDDESPSTPLASKEELLADSQPEG